MSHAVEMKRLTYSYGPTPALNGVDLVVREGESVALMGPSGCGKSTLLHCVAGILEPDGGHLKVVGKDLTGMGSAERARFRLANLGLVFQLGEMISELTLFENVLLPLQVLGWSRRDAVARASALLDELGVGDVQHRRAGEVSGGQAQRAAVARAVAPRPRLILADEPTGSLDTVSAEGLMDVLVDAAKGNGSSLLVVTHDHRVAAHLDRHVSMLDGAVLRMSAA